VVDYQRETVYAFLSVLDVQDYGILFKDPRSPFGSCNLSTFPGIDPSNRPACDTAIQRTLPRLAFWLHKRPSVSLTEGRDARERWDAWVWVNKFSAIIVRKIHFRATKIDGLDQSVSCGKENPHSGGRQLPSWPGICRLALAFGKRLVFTFVEIPPY